MTIFPAHAECSNCSFRGASGEPGKLLCRKARPVAHEITGEAVWPKVDPDFWCGDYRPPWNCPGMVYPRHVLDDLRG